MPDDNRRYSDHVKKASDHDLLIRLHTKMDAVCAAHKETREEVKAFADRIDTRCETRLGLINRNHEHIMDKTTFKWLFGLLILALVTLYSVAVTNTISLTRNEAQIISNGIQIGLNAEALEKLIERGE